MSGVKLVVLWSFSHCLTVSLFVVFVLRVRFDFKQEIRSVERGYLSHCFKSRSRDLGQQFKKI